MLQFRCENDFDQMELERKDQRTISFRALSRVMQTQSIPRFNCVCGPSSYNHTAIFGCLGPTHMSSVATCDVFSCRRVPVFHCFHVMDLEHVLQVRKHSAQTNCHIKKMRGFAFSEYMVDRHNVNIEWLYTGVITGEYRIWPAGVLIPYTPVYNCVQHSLFTVGCTGPSLKSHYDLLSLLPVKEKPTRLDPE